ncbi:YibE/F family protein [Acidipropionibacterium timonense]|uniref:YibE/F family protein n=1 Tax=Acidipropionibacterium timonense TaxID=2161818 RepID=UPI00103067CE|nr:YibE/F family protein [Acidipropionibacterium timonense]
MDDVRHSHPGHQPRTAEQRARERSALGRLLLLLTPLALATIVGLVALWPHDVDRHISSDSAAWNAPGVSFVQGTVSSVRAGSCNGQAGSGGSGSSGRQDVCDQIAVHVDEGPEKGQTASITLTAAVSASGVHAGQVIRMYRVPTGTNQVTYQFYDFERTMPLGLIAALFLVVVVAVARWRGLAAVVSLVLAFLILGRFLYPALVSGSQPVLVGLVGSAAIMFVVIYLTHGFSTRTTTALIGTLFGLLLAAGLGWAATRWAHLTGVTSEDDFVLAASAPDVRLQGVIICGVIIAGLGVLNDVTVTQASAVWELADTATSRRDLYRRAMRIGRDHIASSVYTIAFATAGAAMSSLLLLMIYRLPLIDMLRSESFAEEIVRTLIGSIGLVLSVPLTTGIGALLAWHTLQGQRRPGPTDHRSAHVDRPSAHAVARTDGSGSDPTGTDRFRRPASS